ncbi:MarR family winged helix-turn-helix transcriptional regulator [Neomicrococcus lactis]|uniref:DNA-binding MarR family transcriptional regulator n=1 Tax=Neomicrococcus lactis TaxID=732241 RepID=A0A7W9DBY6_9MICC|nr:MarR family transcriptional regulator [Neomicrococcus lactis]MBB5599165.1 DNA-binding MarR family transcriptional regulator [Neomicrococcus lactis]
MTQSPVETELDRLARSPLAEEVTFLIARVTSVSNAKANAALADLGLKVRSYSVLNLAASDLQPTQRELAQMLSLDPSQIVSLVDDLEANGLILREQDQRDRRQKVISATPDGIKLLKEARKRTQEAQAESLAPLSPEEQVVFREMMVRLSFNA